MELDEAVRQVSPFRGWHLLTFVTMGISAFSALAFHGMAIVFVGWEPPHHCKPVKGLPINESVPCEYRDDGTCELSQCNMYRNFSIDNSTIPCANGWTYYAEGGRTINTDWNLVCQRNYLAELSQTIYQVACLIAEVASGVIVDRFGRKTTHIVSHLLVVVLGIGVAFTQHYVAFLVLRFAVAFPVIASVQSGIVYMLELFDSSRRTVAGVAFELLWVVDYWIFGILGYFLRDWRYLYLTCSLTSLLWVVYIWVIPESVYWLVANGYYQKAERALKYMGKKNGIKGVDIHLTDPSEEKPPLLADKKEKEQKHEHLDNTTNTEPADEAAKHNVTKYTLLDLFKDKHIAKHTIIISLLWFANQLIFYSILLSIPSLAGDRFLNYFILGLPEVAGYVSIIFVAEKFGRRIPLAVFHVVAGVSLGIKIFVPNTTAAGVNLIPFKVTVTMIGKFGISATFALVVLYTPELFPTNLRSQAFGGSNILGRIGNISAPFVAYAAKRLPWVPNAIYAVISISVGLCALLLPETRGRALPQELADIHTWYADDEKKKMINKAKDAEAVNGFTKSSDHVSTV